MEITIRQQAVQFRTILNNLLRGNMVAIHENVLYVLNPDKDLELNNEYLIAIPVDAQNRGLVEALHTFVEGVTANQLSRETGNKYEFKGRRYRLRGN